MKIRYYPVPGGASILSCTGTGSNVRIPEKIGGLPVTGIAPYAFSSNEAAQAHLPAGTKLLEATDGEPEAPGRERCLGGESLRELLLPPGIRSIGEYAFYNCVGLSRVGLCAGPALVGNGAFMNCRGLKEILVAGPSTAPTCLPGLLEDIQQEVRAVFRSKEGDSVWIFPEYYEESVENGPARIFEHFIHGAGFRYRQCFREDILDAESYDAQFPIARSETDPETLLRIALERLRRPVRLTAAAKGRYLAFLKEKAEDAASLLIRDDDPEGLSFLAERGAFTAESIGRAAEEAARLERARCLSVLLQERHARFAAKKKTFDL
ncbi:hypothetical protein A7X67_15740 [Clostridium sp. W14A]|nr:hypothetical protein A7X67_15740 [Clostridium sp. W14A]